MPSLSFVRTANASYSPSFVPVAVFLGGTAGIGLGIARALAHATKGNCHIIILGRNREAAETAFATFPKPAAESSPLAKYEFIYCDASLLGNIDVALHEVLSRTKTINYVVLSCMHVTSFAADYTSEGLEKKIVLMFYARWKFVRGLAPALEEAHARGEEATVLNIGGGARLAGKLKQNSVSPNVYSFMHLRDQVPTYINLLMEHFAEEYPAITFYNAHPGLVDTNLVNGLQSQGFFFRFLIFLMHVVGRLFGVTGDVAGEYMLYAMLFSKKQGLRYIEARGEEVPPSIRYKDVDREIIWNHFREVVDRDRT